MELQLEAKGLPELRKLLDSIPAEVEKKVIESATRSTANQMRKLMQAKTPVRTGALRDSLKVSMPKNRETGIRRAIIFAQRFYARFIELGFVHKSGRHIPAKPFMRPAFDEIEPQYIDLIIAGIRKSLKKRKLL